MLLKFYYSIYTKCYTENVYFKNISVYRVFYEYSLYYENDSVLSRS